jgi:phosphoglycerate dehydrogenase-like enzyme
MTRVAVLDDYQGRAHELADWSVLGPAVEVTYFRRPMAEEEVALALSGFEVVVLMRERTAFPKGILERLPNLRLLVTTGMGNRSVDMGYLRDRGVVVSGTQGGGASTIEVTWALILSVLKRVTIEDRAMREGSWQLALPADLYDTTLGLAGLGRLGSAMVPVAKAFDMEVIAWSQHLTEERAKQVGARLVSKEELLSQSDVLSIHLVLSDRTRGLFGAADLALMKPTAVLVNTSRGPIVDEAALVDALTSRQIAAAGLDVFDREPIPPDHPLLSLENTVLTPHLGYVTERGFRAMYGQAVEDIAAFLQGKPVRVIE